MHCFYNEKLKVNAKMGPRDPFPPAAMANHRVEKGWIFGAINSLWAWERAQRD